MATKKAAVDPMAPARCKVLLAVNHHPADAEIDLPREKAVAWILRGLAAPIGWEPTPREILDAAEPALNAIQAEALARRGGNPDDPTAWLAVPTYRKRVVQLCRIVARAHSHDSGPEAA